MSAQLALPVLPVADPVWAAERLRELEAERMCAQRAETEARLLAVLDDLDILEASTRNIAADSNLPFRDVCVSLASMRRRGIVGSVRWPVREHPDAYPGYRLCADVVTWWVRS